MNNSFVVEAIRACLGEVYLVGGAVRDTLIGESGKIRDYDFATPLKVEDVISKLEENNYKVIKHSAKFGTVGAIIGKTKVEISTFRTDKYNEYINGVPSEIIFQSDLREDLARRDFTINAIAHDGENYIDPFNGQADIIAEKIRTVGNPSQRFEEDPLRMLRAIRFVSELGFTLTKETFDAIISSNALVKDVSKERVTKEFSKILNGEHWINAIALCIESGLFERLLDTELSEELKDEYINLLSNYNEEATFRGNRWVILITSLIHAWAQVNFYKNYWRAFNDIFNRFRESFEWSKTFEQNLFDKLSEHIIKEDQTNLEEEYETLVGNNDPRQYVVKDRLLRIKVKQAAIERRFEKAATFARDLIGVQNINFQKRLEKMHDKSLVIQEFKEHMLNSVRYAYLELVEKNAPIESVSELNVVFGKLLKRKDTFDLLSIEIGVDDRKRIIEESILFTNHLLGGRVTSLSNSELIDGNEYFQRSNERLRHIRAAYIRELVELRKPPFPDDIAERRARLNFRTSKVVIEMFGEDSYEYLSHLMDYYKWKSLATSSLEEFMKLYEKMNIVMDKIFSNVAYTDHINPDSQYIDNALCLIHAASLTNDIDEKISIIRNIVANYKLVITKLRKNANRYQLLLEWLDTCKALLAVDYISSGEILIKFPNLTTYHYSDDDESYFKAILPEIDKIRTHFYDIEAFLCKINDVDTDLVINDQTLLSISLLHGSRIIDDELTFSIFKNYLSSLVNESVPLEPVSLINEERNLVQDPNNSMTMELIQKKGENEFVELKQSWRYDTKSREIDPTGAVLDSAIRAIAAFMNSSGGKLIIGVNDDRVVTGLEEADFIQFKKKEKTQLGLQDAFRKLIDDHLGKAIGHALAMLKSVDFEVINQKTICVIDVKPSIEDVFYKDKYYVRESGSTRALSIKEYSTHKANRVNSVLSRESMS